MAKKSSTLETIIAINAKVGSGFSQVGSTLTELGSMVNGLSQQLINFGKESTEVYRDYEKSMKDAEVALSTTYGRNTKALMDVMDQLDAHATEWAATTIFHTDDVANAINNAAHAGWDYEKIMSGVPAAMRLAQAGSLDLSEAVDYIVKSTSAAGVSFDDLGHFIDIWTYASNSSASTIGEFGDAMLRMGATMRFAADPEELMTLIAVTANAGSTGSAAGTLIRNSILRLIAPTKKATEAMAELGATSDETAGLMEDESLAAANAELAAHGFSAFDENGEMKNILDIYRELYVALGEIAGGYEDIDRNEQALKILSSIFPTRTITEALTLIRGAAEGYDGLYESMKGGSADQYGEYAAATMMDTLNGKIETFLSKVERLKQVTGEKLSDEIEGVLGDLGGFVDSLAEMDDKNFEALVSGLEVIALAGPGLMLAGTFFRILGSGGLVGLGVIGIAAAAAAIEKLNEAEFRENFGDMALDLSAMHNYALSLGTDFQTAYAATDKFRGALDTSIEKFREASGIFSSKLLTLTVTKATLSQEDIESLVAMGSEMGTYLLDSIEAAFSKDSEYFYMIFGGDEGNAAENPIYQSITEKLYGAYDDATQEAKTLGEKMREALWDAYDNDGKIDQDEYRRIQELVKAYNRAVAEAVTASENDENFTRLQARLMQAQTGGFDDVKALVQETTEQRDEAKKKETEDYYNAYVRLQKSGGTQAELDALTAQHEQYQAGVDDTYDEFIMSMWENTLTGSALSEAYSMTGGIVDTLLARGMSAEQAQEEVKKALTGQQKTDLAKYLGNMVASLGGEDAIAEKIERYNASGNTEMANWLTRILGESYLLNDFYKVMRTDKYTWDYFGLLGEYETEQKRGRGLSMTWLSDLIGGIENANTQEQNRSAFEAMMGGITREQALSDLMNINSSGISEMMLAARDIIGGGDKYNHKDFLKTFLFRLGDDAYYKSDLFDEDTGRRLYSIMEGLKETYDFDKVIADLGDEYANSADKSMNDFYAMWSLLYGNASQTPDVYRKGAGYGAFDENGIAINWNTEELYGAIDTLKGEQITTYISGDATDLHMDIMNEDGQTLMENVTGNPAQLQEVINQFQGQTVYVRIVGQNLMDAYAEGGRATEASIFGEGDTAEWAIPEEHSRRTAELLDAARAASGFTWPELISMFGGLNANPANKQTTIVYSPTINAADASGVERALRDDKRRFERWMEEKEMRDAAEVYA